MWPVLGLLEELLLLGLLLEEPEPMLGLLTELLPVLLEPPLLLGLLLEEPELIPGLLLELLLEPLLGLLEELLELSVLLEVWVEDEAFSSVSAMEASSVFSVSSFSVLTVDDVLELLSFELLVSALLVQAEKETIRAKARSKVKTFFFIM